jgi:glycosyltransferase involved in cell wall biosynthesis
LSGNGHAVRVFTFSHQYPAWLYPGRSQLEPIREARIESVEAVFAPFDPRTWRSGLQRMLAWGSETVIIPWWSTAQAPLNAWLADSLKPAGIRIVYLIHNTLPHEQRAFDRPLARLALGRGDAFVAHSSFEAERLRQLLPAAKTVEVCPHPPYDWLNPYRIPKPDARETLAIPPGEKVLLQFGFVRPYKGLSMLLQALARLASPSVLLVAGEFWQSPARVQRQIDHLGLAERVRLIDHYLSPAEAGTLFSAADLLVTPTLQGSQSGALRLAQGFGLPAVATPAALGSLFPEEGITLVPAGDVPALARTLQKQFDHPANFVPPDASVGWNRLADALLRACQAGGDA